MANLTIPDVVGRRWGARGRGRHRASGGFGGVRFYSEPWFATEELVELSPGVAVVVTTAPRAPTLLSGGGSGRRECELADLGALIAPGSRGLEVQLSLGADRRLYASIFIDGEWYRGSVDLSEVLCRIAENVALHHVASSEAPPQEIAEDPETVE